MTFFALIAEDPVMNIIYEMTGNTLSRDILPTLSGVTGGAGYLAVFSFEREFGFVVIESVFIPGLLFVAVFTILP